MNLIAYTANFILIVPDTCADPLAGNAWNSGAGTSGYFPHSTIIYKGFINALVDTDVSNYSINSNKVYLCGFSMGGFMTERMACESNGKFAAFASAGGTIRNGITTCNPTRAIPLAHFY
jgi:polyhydroxybutyrate depolymerase